MIHYHGGPITPETCAYRAWNRRHAFVSYAHPHQIGFVASLTQSFALDNGAFSFWRKGATSDWGGFYEWCDKWLNHPACDWAVIPDVIDGTEHDNDRLVETWPYGHRGVPVWHLNESTERLVALAQEWPRIALGSSGDYDVAKPNQCLARLAECLPAICDDDDRPTVKLHGLRMLNPALVTNVPLSSADSTNVARNIKLDVRWTGAYAPQTKETRADILIERIEQAQSPPRMTWQPGEQIRVPDVPPDDESLFQLTIMDVSA